MKYPNVLRQGSTIAITAFSCGIAKAHQPRFDIIKQHLEFCGFKVVVGTCLYGELKHVSAPIEQRLEELMTFLLDDNIDAIYPPWGGELAMELLPLIDFAKLEHTRPKWILGFSDISTVAAVFTSRLRWATGHCSNLMDLVPKATDALTSNTLNHLATPQGESFSQNALGMYAGQWPDIVNYPANGIAPDTPLNWKWLIKPEFGSAIEGRLIGGCWDTLLHLFDTEYLGLEALSRDYPEGVVLYLENAEMSPTDVARTLLSMQFKGVFQYINGLLLGRSAVPEPTDEEALTYYEVIQKGLANTDIPVIYDMDIGHLPPNLTLVNGALAHVSLDEVGVIKQSMV
ncbi:S66 peptidase family protein [Vibrio sinaloensis]|uniref:Peptidase S66 n=1 Tax=Photobacterium sp. (strain ATCC 43367) TaxID=379097 RepID=A0A0A5JPJ6_PHOS4|nr:S66 peptidase family protein [Vibrio sinaloensis]KGY09873.1 hypothetical protein NM06_02855 [Vibrio sinaloensis]